MALALLTPVPLEHLADGVVICARQGRVAFGSQAWEIFGKIDRESGEGTPVLIYASHANIPAAPRITWIGGVAAVRVDVRRLQIAVAEPRASRRHGNAEVGEHRALVEP